MQILAEYYCMHIATCEYVTKARIFHYLYMGSDLNIPLIQYRGCILTYLLILLRL